MLELLFDVLQLPGDPVGPFAPYWMVVDVGPWLGLRKRISMWRNVAPGKFGMVFESSSCAGAPKCVAAPASHLQGLSIRLPEFALVNFM